MESGSIYSGIQRARNSLAKAADFIESRHQGQQGIMRRKNLEFIGHYVAKAISELTDVATWIEQDIGQQGE